MAVTTPFQVVTIMILMALVLTWYTTQLSGTVARLPTGSV
jgi:hypothetical protein